MPEPILADLDEATCHVVVLCAEHGDMVILRAVIYLDNKDRYMKFIIKLFPGITITLICALCAFTFKTSTNIRNVLKQYDETLAVVHWDHIEVRAKDENQRLIIADAWTRIPIHLYFGGRPRHNIHHIFEQTLEAYRVQLKRQTFCGKAKAAAAGVQSQDVERHVGGGLNQHIESARVNLSRPQVTGKSGDRRRQADVGQTPPSKAFAWIPGRHPEDVIVVDFGGFDSGVSSYMLMRRGCRVHFCFFTQRRCARLA